MANGKGLRAKLKIFIRKYIEMSPGKFLRVLHFRLLFLFSLPMCNKSPGKKQTTEEKGVKKTERFSIT